MKPRPIMPSMPGSGTGVPPEVEPPEVEPPEVEPPEVDPPEVVVDPPDVVLEHHLVHLQPHLPVAIAGEEVIIKAAAAVAAVSASLRVISIPP